MAEKVTEVAKKKEKKHRQTKGNSQLRKQGSRLWRMAQKYTMLEVQCSSFPFRAILSAGAGPLQVHGPSFKELQAFLC